MVLPEGSPQPFLCLYILQKHTVSDPWTPALGFFFLHPKPRWFYTESYLENTLLSCVLFSSTTSLIKSCWFWKPKQAAFISLLKGHLRVPFYLGWLVRVLSGTIRDGGPWFGDCMVPLSLQEQQRWEPPWLCLWRLLAVRPGLDDRETRPRTHRRL